MGNVQVTQDSSPFLPSTGVTVDQSGIATAVGAVTLFSKIFDMRQKSAFSFNVQSTSGSTGVGPTSGTPVTSWKIFACNDFDSTRQAQKPGTFFDVTSDLGGANSVTPPGVHQWNGAAFTGASQSDHVSSWACPWAFIQFRLIQSSGTGIYTGQFFASEV